MWSRHHSFLQDSVLSIAFASLSLWELSEMGAGGAWVTPSLHTENLARTSPPVFFFILGVGRKVNEGAVPRPACSRSGFGESLCGISCSTPPRSNVSCQDQLVPSWRSLKNDFPAVRGCATVLLFGHLLSGWPTGSSHTGQPEWVKSKGRQYSSLPPLSLLSQLSDVRSSKALHMALCFLIIHLTGPQNFHKSEEAPEENLRPLRVP